MDLVKLISDGDLDAVRRLINGGYDVNRYVYDSEFQWAPIHQAAYNDRIDILTFLLEQENINVSARTSHDRTPLHLACAYEDVSTEVVRLLVDAGCDVNVREDYYHDAALHVAARHECADKVKILIEAGADIEAANIKNRTPLSYAAKYGRVSNVEVLIAAGADVNAVDKEGFTPLMLAVSQNEEDVVKVMLPSLDVDDINRVEKTNGFNALMMTRSRRIAAMLLERGADANIISNGGQFALQQNIKHCKDFETFEYLFDRTDAEIIRTNEQILFDTIFSSSHNTHKHRDYFCAAELLIASGYVSADVYRVYQTLLVFNDHCSQNDLWVRYESLFRLIFQNFQFDDTTHSKYINGICDYAFKSRTPRFGFKILDILVNYGLNVDYKSCVHDLPIVVKRIVRENPELITEILPYCISVEPWDVVNVIENTPKEYPDVDLSYLSDYVFAKMNCRSLKSLCRTTIRNIVRKLNITKTKRVILLIQSLPLPEVLKNYLRYK